MVHIENLYIRHYVFNVDTGGVISKKEASIYGDSAWTNWMWYYYNDNGNGWESGGGFRAGNASLNLFCSSFIFNLNH